MKKTATDSSVHEFLYEINTYLEEGITEEELQYTKNSITLSEARDYETPWQKAGFLRRILDYDLDKNYVKEQSKLLQSMSTEDINTIAQKEIKPEELIIVVVGDKATVFEGLNQLGYPVKEINKQGEIL